MEGKLKKREPSSILIWYTHTHGRVFVQQRTHPCWCDGDSADKFVELLVNAYDELKVAWDGVSLLVVSCVVQHYKLKFESTRCHVPYPHQKPETENI